MVKFDFDWRLRGDSTDVDANPEQHPVNSIVAL
jgi:hypothetical protein